MPTHQPQTPNSQNVVGQVPFVWWRLPQVDDPNGVIYQLEGTQWEEIDLTSLAASGQEKRFLLSPFAAQSHNQASSSRSTTQVFQLKGDILPLAALVSKGHLDPSSQTTHLPSRQDVNGAGLLPTDNAEAALRYQSLVRKAISVIKSGKYSKIVCSHKIDYQIVPVEGNMASDDQQPTTGQGHLTDWELVWQELFLRLELLYPAAFVSMLWHPDFGRWITASPEVLLRQSTADGTQHYSTVSLAGTRPSSIPPNQNWGEKEVGEQAHVTDFIQRQLAALSDPDGGPANVKVKVDGPHSHQAGPVSHLQTVLTWSVPTESPIKVGQILATLHPTSATSGSPKAEALDFLRDQEGYDRELYAGYMGPVDDHGLRTYVNLRTMKVDQDRVSLYVGAGITSGSDPVAEWNETLNKALTLLRPLVQTLADAGLELKLI